MSNDFENDDFARNIRVLMSISQHEHVRMMVYNFEFRIERFLQFIVISTNCIDKITCGVENESKEMWSKVFCYGWLSPEGKFITVPFARHEYTVKEITGYRTCDDACKKGWIKFTCGMAYNHKGETLFDRMSDKEKISLPTYTDRRGRILE